MNKTTAQSTRVRNAREEQTRDYADMPVAQLDHAYRNWGAEVEVDGDERARLAVTTVLEDPRDLPDATIDGRVTPVIAKVKTLANTAHVTPNKDVPLNQEGADALIERFILEGQLKPHSSVVVYQPTDLARTAPFDQDAGDPEYLPTRTSVWHESDAQTLAVGGGLWERTTNLESPRPDWALTHETEVGGTVAVNAMSDAGRKTVELYADVPEQFRAIAQFFNDAADDLEKTQAAVKAAQAAGVTA